MMYADFTYYSGEYGGNTVPQASWNHFAMHAGAYIDSLVFGRIKSEADISDSVKMATCACADVLYLWDGTQSFESRNAGVKSETTDGYRVDYADPDATFNMLSAKIYAAADMYLPINHPLRYRGAAKSGATCKMNDYIEVDGYEG